MQDMSWDDAYQFRPDMVAGPGDLAEANHAAAIAAFHEAAERLAPLFADAEVIHAYSRADAIRDGVLHAVPAEVARRAGFAHPVAVTDSLWLAAVAWDEGNGAALEEADRLAELLAAAARACRAAGQGEDRTTFQFWHIPNEPIRDHDADLHTTMTVVVHVGPGDTAAPVVTIMLECDD